LPRRADAARLYAVWTGEFNDRSAIVALPAKADRCYVVNPHVRSAVSGAIASATRHNLAKSRC